jgi:hypothetical protein
MSEIPEEIRQAGWRAFRAAVVDGVDGPQVYERTLEAIVTAVAAQSVGEDYWTPEPVGNEAVAEWWQQQPESGEVSS